MLFLKKNVNVGLYSDMKRPISFTLGMMIETTNLYIVISVWMTLTFIQGHICMRNKNISVQFCCKFCN